MSRPAPASDRSTYGHSPGGYGAWYAWMKAEGVPVHRWLLPVDQAWQKLADQPIAFLRILNEPIPDYLYLHDPDLVQWVEKGNILVLLGVQAPVADVPFDSRLSSPEGLVKIDTRRRETEVGQSNRLLQDDQGAVVWEYFMGNSRGRVVLSSTPYLGANAYQSSPGNFSFLRSLVGGGKVPVWIDEYSHGYRTGSVPRATLANSRDWLSYLAQTPLVLLAGQGLLVGGLAVLALNHRLGQPRPLPKKLRENGVAYIQALAEVLRQSESDDFVVDLIGKAERQRLQQHLGLGSQPLETEVVVQAWVDQTGQPPGPLRSVLTSVPKHRSRQELLAWLKNWQRFKFPPHG